MTAFICADCRQPIETPKTQGVLTDMGWMHVHCDPRPCSCNALDWSKVNNGVGRLSINEHHPACYKFSGVYWFSHPPVTMGEMLKVEDNMTELLIVDFGDSVCVKVEKGAFTLRLNPLDIGVPMREGQCNVFYRPFDVIKAALDGGEKPLPRVERVRGSEDAPYTLHFAPSDGVGWLMTQGMYDALTELNGGKPLPIWSGGEWVKILDDPGLHIWHYSRGR